MRKRLLSFILLSALILCTLSGCGASDTAADTNTLTKTGSMELQFANQFSVDYYDGGYKMINLADGEKFIVVPEGKALPADVGSDVVPLYQPMDNIYLAATSAMCLFDAIDGLGNIKLSGTKADGWYIENARRAMENGEIKFAGKYNEPDYEMLVSSDCSVAIESMMIGHASDVKDKLEELGIPVLTDQSSMESHPLGRTEWIKLYAALINKEDAAQTLFDDQVAYLDDVSGSEPTGKTAAFFHISSSGRVVARKTGDYVSEMIELAGGEYVFKDLGDPDTKTSTVTIEMETFFKTARDADYIIYNSTIGGEVKSLEELMQKSDLLADFKAVQNGNVWCTNKNMYQETTQLGQMIQSFHTVFSGQADDLTELPYLYRLT